MCHIDARGRYVQEGSGHHTNRRYFGRRSRQMFPVTGYNKFLILFSVVSSHNSANWPWNVEYLRIIALRNFTNCAAQWAKFAAEKRWS